MYIVINDIPIKDSNIKEISKIQKLDKKLYNTLVRDLTRYPGFDTKKWAEGRNYDCYQNDVLRYLDNLVKANPECVLAKDGGILKALNKENLYTSIEFISTYEFNWYKMPELYFYTLQTETTTILSQIYFSKEEAEESQDNLLNILNDGVLFKISL